MDSPGCLPSFSLVLCSSKVEEMYCGFQDRDSQSNFFSSLTTLDVIVCDKLKIVCLFQSIILNCSCEVEALTYLVQHCLWNVKHFTQVMCLQELQA